MRQAKRVLRPQVMNVVDIAVVQVKCVPGEDEINVEEVLGHSLARFEFTLGTSFDLQFLTMDGTRLLAVRRYIVSEVTERVAVSDINHYQTLTKTVFDRKCAPINDLIVLHEDGNELRKNFADASADDLELDDMSPASLQKTMKQLRGKGFKVGTTQDTMVKSIRKHLSDASAAKE